VLAAAIIFLGTYLVLAVGRLPGFRVDRTGAAIIGAGIVGLAIGALIADRDDDYYYDRSYYRHRRYVSLDGYPGYYYYYDGYPNRYYRDRYYDRYYGRYYSNRWDRGYNRIDRWYGREHGYRDRRDYRRDYRDERRHWRD
jgi:hypothetical protein